MAYTSGMGPWWEQIQGQVNRAKATGAITGKQSQDIAYGGAQGAVESVYNAERASRTQAIQESQFQQSLASQQSQFQQTQAFNQENAAANRAASGTSGLTSAAVTLGGQYLASNSTALSSGVKAAYTGIKNFISPSSSIAGGAGTPGAGVGTAASGDLMAAGGQGAAVGSGGAGVGEYGAMSAAELSAIEAETGAATGATLGGVAGTLGVVAGYAGAAITAAHYGMPVLGKLLGAQSDEEYAKDPSSNLMTQGANITSREWDRPVEAGMEALHIPVPGEDTLVGGLLNPGSKLLKAIGCIIVTACTDRYSPEVKIARLYRDTFLDADQLRGYYALAEKIVPVLERNERCRKNVKKYLVDRLIDYGAYRLGRNMVRPRWSSVIVSKAFLATIKTIGMILPVYVRANGEVL